MREHGREPEGTQNAECGSISAEVHYGQAPGASGVYQDFQARTDYMLARSRASVRKQLMPYRYRKLIEFEQSDDPETAYLGWTLFEDRDTKTLILRNDEDPQRSDSQCH